MDKVKVYIKLPSGERIPAEGAWIEFEEEGKHGTMARLVTSLFGEWVAFNRKYYGRDFM